MKKVLSLGFLLVVAMAIAMPASAHNRVESRPASIDLRDASIAHDHVQSLEVFAGATILDGFAHVELPAPSIADELALRFASTDVESPSELRVFDRAVSRELASGPRRFTLQSKSSEWSELGRKPWWGEENKAYPFREPATGLVYARARWYDAESGTFLTPDPMGYQDSSNLYAFCANDPVNCSDPLGLYDPAAFGHKILRGGDWLKNKVSQASLSAPESGIGVVDAGNRMVNVAAETTINTGIDFAAGFVGGFFTIGERSGEAIGEYDSSTPWRSGGRVALSVGLDAVATVGYAAGIAGVANRTITAASEALMPSAMFDLSITAAGEAEILGSLAPRITRAMVEEQRMRALIEAMPSPYAGVREASAYLRTMGVSRADRVRILQSFEAEGMTVRTAGASEFGVRYYGGAANPGGAYLFETFPASRGTLALRQRWNAMTGFRQWQIRPGATVIEGRAAAQEAYLPGRQIQKFILDWQKNMF